VVFTAGARPEEADVSAVHLLKRPRVLLHILIDMKATCLVKLKLGKKTKVAFVQIAFRF
jgi:hypothetical protein